MMSPKAGKNGLFPPNDVHAYADRVEGIDADHYFDSQVRGELVAAMKRWPLLPSVLGLKVTDEPLGD
jgi:hypothetical protein